MVHITYHVSYFSKCFNIQLKGVEFTVFQSQSAIDLFHYNYFNYDNYITIRPILFLHPQSSGIFVIIMIVASCLCCCSGSCLCSSRMPRGCRICGGVGLFLGALATAVFVAWVALGTYLVLRVRGADTICRNTIAYLSLLYLYLVVLVIVGVIIVIWHCKDWRRGQSDDTGGAGRTRTKKKISDP